MELGLCNPMWGYWWRWYSVKPPDHWLFWTLNQLGWSTEVIAAVLMVVPATREIGGLFIVGIFLCIATQIRLGFLTEMVMACGLLYLSPDGTFGRVLEAWLPAAAPVAAVSYEPLGTVLQAGLVGYLLLLPLAHAGLYYNFYAGRVLPRPFQRALERYTNVFGIIIWRVFSVDIINFFVRLHRRGPQGDVPLRPLGSWPRFNHVGEMICLASLFTTLKYYPSDNAIFRERVVRYARTLPRERGERVVFEYVSVIKHADRFDWVPVGEFEVDPDAGSIAERWFDPSISPRSAHAVSPVHAGAVPGSYRPATS